MMLWMAGMVDLFLSLVLLASVLLGLWRGLVRSEVLALAGWFAASCWRSRWGWTAQRLAAAQDFAEPLRHAGRLCGIVGLISASPVNQLIYDALLLLQHRGQDAAGIVPDAGHASSSCTRPRAWSRRVPHPQHARAAGQRRPRPGALSDRRQRYSGGGAALLRQRPFGIVLVHNGNLTNADRSSARC